MFDGDNKIYIIVFIVLLVQYVYATYALMQLAYLGFAVKKYMLYNAFIMLVFFIGSTVFLIKYKKTIAIKKQELFKQSTQPKQGLNTTNEHNLSKDTLPDDTVIAKLLAEDDLKQELNNVIDSDND